jgi:teichuronic acid biosynthesis glycosyltransferase TuaH
VVKRSGGVIATSQPVADTLSRQYAIPSPPVVENGVDLDHFRPQPVPWRQRRGAVYVGALDARFAWDDVIDLANAHPAERIDLYGPNPGRPPALPPNVTLRGSVSYEHVPSMLATYRVGVIPLKRGPTNDARSPMKLFEYLASGLSVVALATRSISAHGISDVHTYTDRATCRLAFERALTVPPNGSGVAAAAAMSWSARAQMVLRASEEMTCCH